MRRRSDKMREGERTVCVCHVTYNSASSPFQIEREALWCIFLFSAFSVRYISSPIVFSIWGLLLCLSRSIVCPGCGHWQANFPHAAPLCIGKYKNDSARSLLDSVPCLPCNGISEFPTAAAAVADWRLLYPHTHTHTHSTIKCIVDQHKSAYYHHKRLVHSDEIISLLLLLLPY